jgi:hypothetical protein
MVRTEDGMKKAGSLIRPESDCSRSPAEGPQSASVLPGKQGRRMHSVPSLQRNFMAWVRATNGRCRRNSLINFVFGTWVMRARDLI